MFQQLDESFYPVGARNAGIALLATGSASMFAGLMGCCTACVKSRKLRFLFCLLLTALVVAQCTLAGMAVSDSEDMIKIEGYAHAYWAKASVDTRVAYQNANSCCGYALFHDKDAGCAVKDALGCRASLRNWWYSTLLGTGYVLFANAAAVLVGILFALVIMFDPQKSDGFSRPQKMFASMSERQ